MCWDFSVFYAKFLQESNACFCLHPVSDYLVVIYIQCIKADVNMKLQISENMTPRAIHPTRIPPGILG